MSGEVFDKLMFQVLALLDTQSRILFVAFALAGDSTITMLTHFEKNTSATYFVLTFKTDNTLPVTMSIPGEGNIFYIHVRRA